MPGEHEVREVRIGRVLRASGIKGEVRLQLFRPRRRLGSAHGGGEIALEREGEADERFVILRARFVDPTHVVVALRGIADRTRAEALAGAWVSVDLDALPEAITDEADQLLFARAIDDESGEDLGVVRAIADNGAQALIVLGEGEDERLVPCVDAFVKKVERTERGERVVRLRSIPGLLD